MRRRHVPQRTCIVCRRVLSKRELIRVVRTPEEHIVIDEAGKKPGRGAYLCRDRACVEKALKGNQLDHALRATLSSEEKEQLAESIAKLWPETTG